MLGRVLVADSLMFAPARWRRTHRTRRESRTQNIQQRQRLGSHIIGKLIDRGLLQGWKLVNTVSIPGVLVCDTFYDVLYKDKNAVELANSSIYI